jgi:parallel beta-helix repeat protein
MLRAIFLFALVLAAHPAAADDESTIAVTSAFSSGPGSIREAIEKANASKSVKRIVSRLRPGTVVHVFRQLPVLAAPGVEVEADGLTLKGGTCMRADGRRGCDGLVIGGPSIVVRKLRATGFTFDGIAVRGIDAKGVRIEECEAFENEDDGVGVSHGASDVVVERCTLERNGFRTKGKGILVFEYANAELRNNTVRHNRDGVTISRRARARLVGNTIVENFDKGLGVTGAEASGQDNTVARNGVPKDGGEPGPNADGIRVTLDSRLTLENTTVTDNGDVGVVVLDSSNVTLEGGRVSGNKGPGLNARDHAVVELRGVDLDGNAGGEFRLDGEAKLVRPGK